MLYQNLSAVCRIAVVGVATYAALVIILRLAGKRSLAKLNAFDLVVTVALGSTLATILLNRDVALVEGAAALGLLVGLQLTATWLSVRFRWTRRLLKSEPTLVVRDGRRLADALATQRVTEGEIHQAVRAHGLGDLDAVAAVVVETTATSASSRRPRPAHSRRWPPSTASSPPTAGRHEPPPSQVTDHDGPRLRAAAADRRRWDRHRRSPPGVVRRRGSMRRCRMPGLIEDYGVIGDLHSTALIGRDGSIDWLCLPRFDSPACFAALLDDDEAGHWQLAPTAGGPSTRRRYRGDTLILESEWDTADGTVRVIDFMPPRGEAADVVRIVEGVTGRVPMGMRMRLRFDYGHIAPWVRHQDGDLAAVAGPDAVWLRSPVPLQHHDGGADARFAVEAGQRFPFVLTYQPSHLPQPTPVDPSRAIDEAERFWNDWAARCTYDGPWAPAVRRSLITLKALTYAPTGGIVAAATTSLPEQIGGPRNWDYRFCWLRDATFTLQALLSTGYDAEAVAWRDWLLRAVAGDPADVQIMYGLDGTRRIPEQTLDWLSGYAGSRPVRIGNGAVGQLQLDVWGEVLEGLHLGRETGISPNDTAWDLQRALLDHLEGIWQQPDNSLWEVRGPRRHFVHSKVLAWAAFDRAIQAVERHGLDGPTHRWRALRDHIHTEVCSRGFDADRGTFTQTYGSRGLDAALLLMPRVGFLPWTDPRVVGTVDAIQRELCVDGFVRRYDPQADDNVDGLPGGEGVFIACSFWLVDALHGAGRTDAARALFERLLDLRNDLGLLSEEYDPVQGHHLGNTPQAYSHVGLVNSAHMLAGGPAQTDRPQ